MIRKLVILLGFLILSVVILINYTNFIHPERNEFGYCDKLGRSLNVHEITDRTIEVLINDLKSNNNLNLSTFGDKPIKQYESVSSFYEINPDCCWGKLSEARGKTIEPMIKEYGTNFYVVRINYVSDDTTDPERVSNVRYSMSVCGDRLSSIHSHRSTEPNL